MSLGYLLRPLVSHTLSAAYRYPSCHAALPAGQQSVLPGLWFSVYTSGYFADNMTFFSSNTPFATGVTNDLTNLVRGTNGLFPAIQVAVYFSVMWTGFFLANVTGVYMISINSDDASFVWMGQNALPGQFTTANALINNGGIHPMKVGAAMMSMTAGVLYPIRIAYGQKDGGFDCQFLFTQPGSTMATGAGAFYHTPFPPPPPPLCTMTPQQTAVSTVPEYKVLTNVSSSDTCCVSCQMDPNCGGWVYDDTVSDLSSLVMSKSSILHVKRAPFAVAETGQWSHLPPPGITGVYGAHHRS